MARLGSLVAGKTQENQLHLIWRNYGWWLITATTLLLFAGLLEFIGIGALIPLITWMTSDQIYSENPFARILLGVLGFFRVPQNYYLEGALAVFLCAIGFKFIFLFFQSKLMHRRLLDVELQFKNKVFFSFLDARWEFLLNTKESSVLNAVSAETRKLSNAVLLICNILASGIHSLVYLALAVMVSWEILAVTAISLFVLAPLFLSVARKTESLQIKYVQYNALILKRVSQVFWGLKYLKSTQGLNPVKEEFRVDNRERANIEHKTYTLKQIFVLGREPISMLVAVGIIYWGIRFQGLALANILIIGYSVHRLYGQISLLAGYVNDFKEARPGAQVCFDIMNTHKQHQEKVSGKNYRGLKKEIEFQKVSFSYGPSAPVLSDFSLRIQKGQMVAFVGKSGGGKTTAVDLLTGLLKPLSGKILIDGQDLQTLNLASFRERISYVSQETFLVDGTIRENVLMGQRMDDSQLEKILTASHCDEFIRRLPEGLETRIGEMGKGLSGGQKQRLSIARALARSPEILILDEPTSALDADSETYIREMLQSLQGQVTIFIIAHRRSTIESADVLVSFEKGSAQVDLEALGGEALA